MYRLYAQRRLAAYRACFQGWFGDGVEHVCAMRAALTLVARELHDRGIDPSDTEAARPVIDAVARPRVRQRRAAEPMWLFSQDLQSSPGGLRRSGHGMRNRRLRCLRSGRDLRWRRH